MCSVGHVLLQCTVEIHRQPVLLLLRQLLLLLLLWPLLLYTMRWSCLNAVSTVTPSYDSRTSSVSSMLFDRWRWPYWAQQVLLLLLLCCAAC